MPRVVPSELIWPCALDLDDAADIGAGLLRRRRATVVNHVSSLIARNEAGALPTSVREFVNVLDDMAEDASSDASNLLGHWSTALLLSRLAEHEMEPSIVSLLMAGPLYHALKAVSSPVRDQLVTVVSAQDGWIDVLPYKKRVRIPGQGHGEIRVLLRGDTVSIEEVALGGPIVRSLPRGAAADWLEEQDLQLISGSRIEIITDRVISAALLRLQEVNFATDAERRCHHPLSTSASRGYATLARLWPSANQWLELLCPAVIEYPLSTEGKARRSGSFGPGLPIYLSTVPDSWLHAEDLIHELQHLRFSLLVDGRRWFKSWELGEAEYSSPFRPDPRPLRGLHLGLHAFLAVNQLRLLSLRGASCSYSMIEPTMDTHLRNIFCLRSIALHEGLSQQAFDYYSHVFRTLVDQQTEILMRLNNSGSWNSLKESITYQTLGSQAHRTRNCNIKIDLLDEQDINFWQLKGMAQ